MAIEVRNDICPPGSRIDMEQICWFIKRHRLQRKHIDLNSIRRNRLSTHAVASTCNGDVQPVGPVLK